MKRNALRLTLAGTTMLTLLLALSAGVIAQDVQTDYDKSKNFLSYHTYYWAKVEGGNPLMVKRAQDAIDAQLEKKGWSKQQAGGDVAVIALGMTQTKRDLNTFYSGTGWGYGGWGGMGTSTTSVNEYKEGTLVVDLYDSNSRQLLWRGTATDTLSDKPEKNEKKLNKAVEKMFSKFPPESK